MEALQDPGVLLTLGGIVFAAGWFLATVKRDIKELRERVGRLEGKSDGD